MRRGCRRAGVCSSRYKGYMDVARSVMAEGGLRGFYAGILPEYYKVWSEHDSYAA